MACDENCLRVEHARKEAKNDASECKMQKIQLQKEFLEKHNQLRQNIIDEENSDRKKLTVVSVDICMMVVVSFADRGVDSMH